MATVNCMVTHILQNIFFVCSTEEETQVWRVSKWWQKFNFWVNYRFNWTVYPKTYQKINTVVTYSFQFTFSNTLHMH